MWPRKKSTKKPRIKIIPPIVLYAIENESGNLCHVDAITPFFPDKIFPGCLILSDDKEMVSKFLERTKEWTGKPNLELVELRIVRPRNGE
jgi:hypothetical protein